MIVYSKTETLTRGTADQLKAEFALIVAQLLCNFTKEELQDAFDVAVTLREGGEQRADN